MAHVVVVGCGIVGAAIAYELSQVPNLRVSVVDRHAPAQASTGAALGVLMGALSQRPKGNNTKMRLFGIQRYNQWVPELAARTGHRILFNQQGILRLCFEGEDLSVWRSLAQIRQQQGWRLEICERSQLSALYPQLSLNRVIGAVYSPDDRQIDPTALTQGLVEAARQNGANFQFDVVVTKVAPNQLQTSAGLLSFDWLVIAAGVGSTPLIAPLQSVVDIRPVLGQATQVKLEQPLGWPEHQPVITGDDVHLVPLGDGHYWIGATVEFTNPDAVPDRTVLEGVMQQAIGLCPGLAAATVIRQWSGWRPRPEGRPAPIIETVPNYPTVIVASGHYRNGVLLAPATADKVRQMIAP